MFRYIFITLLIFLPLMFCDKSKPRQSGRKEKLQYQCSDLKFKRGVKQQLLRAQSFVDTFKTAVSTFQGAVDTTKNFVENIKSTADIASDVIGAFSSAASIGGPIGEGISAVGSVLSGFLGVFFGKPKSEELKKIEELESITKEGFQETMAMIQNVEKITVEGFKATLEQIITLEKKMDVGFDEVKKLIKDEEEKKDYNNHREKVDNVYAAYQLFLQHPDVSHLEIVCNNYGKLKVECINKNPENVVDWIYEKTVQKANLFQRNFLDYFANQFENDTITFTNLLSIVAYDILTAFKMTAVCNGIRGTSGTEKAQNETRDILLKINQLIQERKKQYTIDVAIEYAKNFQTSCDGPAIEVPATLNTKLSKDQYIAEQYFIRFHNETKPDMNSYVQQKLKEKYPWNNWTTFTIWYDSEKYNTEGGRTELVDAVKSITCSFSGRLVIHAVPSNNVVISKEYVEARGSLEFYANSFSLVDAKCPASQDLINILDEKVGKQFLVAAYYNLLDAKQPATNPATHFVLLKGPRPELYCGAVLITPPG